MTEYMTFRVYEELTYTYTLETETFKPAEAYETV